MRWLFVVTISLFFAVLGNAAFAKGPRTFTLTESDVGQVQTALGYSTILQFDSRPTSAVLGDQDAFKVEYVGNSLTLKPLVPGAKTNLFVFTDYDRFNFRLSTGPSTQVDYVVKIKRKASPSSGIDLNTSSESYPAHDSPSEKMVTVTTNRKVSCKSLTLGVESYSYPKAKPWLVIHFYVKKGQGDGRTEFEFKPELLSVIGGKEPVSVETLYLEQLSVQPNDTPVRGSVLIHKSSRNAGSLSLVLDTFSLKNPRCPHLKVRLGGQVRK